MTADPAAVATSNGQRGRGAHGKVESRERRSPSSIATGVLSGGRSGSCHRVGASETLISVVNLSFSSCYNNQWSSAH